MRLGGFRVSILQDRGLGDAVVRKWEHLMCCFSPEWAEIGVTQAMIMG